MVRGLPRWLSVEESACAYKCRRRRRHGFEPSRWSQSLGREDLLGEEMATHSSIVAWEIPWTEEPGRLQFMGI